MPTVQSFLTSTSATVQLWTVSSDWNANSNTVESIGPGGNGSIRQSASIAGNGGGAGSYAKKLNSNFPQGKTIGYLLPAAGSAVDAWFNDLNLLPRSQTPTIGGWTFNNTSAPSTNNTAPDGTSTATKLVDNSTAAGHYLWTGVTKSAVALAMTFSVYVKAVEISYVVLDISDGSGNNGVSSPVHNIATGASGTGSGSAYGTGFSFVASGLATDDIATGISGNGWYRAWTTVNVDSSANVDVYLSLSNGSITSFVGTGSNGIFMWGLQLTYGTALKPYTATVVDNPKYSLLAKAGTNATATAAGVGQSGSVGDTTFQGGGGFKPTTGTIAGGGGGAAGKNGAGTTATTTAGGAADNGTVTGGAAGANGNNGTEFDGTHGSGSGAGGRSGTGTGFTGGSYGGGGSGAGNGSTAAGGSGGPPLIVINNTLGPLADIVRTRQAVKRAAYW